MSTPTSSSLKRPLPTSSSNNPSTPANATSGTTPRSAATPSGNTTGFRSPATSRAAPVRSPKTLAGTPSLSFKPFGGTSTANTPQLGSSHGSKTLPTGSMSLSHSSPIALDGTPNLSATGPAAGIASPGLQDGLAMGMSMSSMGIAMGLSASTLGVGLAGTSSMGPGRMGDEERRRRLEAVLHALGQRTGRVSQQGLEHLGKRLGLEPGWDIFPEAKMGAGRMLSFAGASIQVDVEFSEKPGETDSVTRAALTYHGLNEGTSEAVKHAGSIMQRDLTPSKGEASITLTLDRFAANLERLSRLDKLSVPGASCFEAVHGIYSSLKKLYEHEKKAARTVLAGTIDDETLDLHVMCNKSGSPQLHTRRHLGVQLDYWRSRHLVPKRQKATVNRDDDSHMDIDGPEQGNQDGTQNNKIDNEDKQDEQDDIDDDIYSLSIECDQSPPGEVQIIRTSTQWISDRIERPPDEVESAMADASHTSLPAMQLDWQEPPLNPTTNDAAPSRARFVAKLNPPLLVPSRIAIAVYASVGVDISHEVSNVAWHAAVLGRLDAPLPAAGTPFRQSFRRKTGRTQQQDWHMNLTIPRAEPGRFLDVLPFNHPKQLVSLLPVLRQYAFLGQLLRRSFEVGKAPSADPFTVQGSSPKHGLNGMQNRSKDERNDLDALMADSDDDLDMSDATSDPEYHLDVSMRTDGQTGPRLSLALAPARCKSVTYLNVDIAPGGVVIMSERGQMVGVVDEKKQTSAEAAWAKALMVAEDLVMWAAWAGDKALHKSS